MRKFIARPKSGEIVSFSTEHISNVTLQPVVFSYEKVKVLVSAYDDPPNTFRIETPLWYRANCGWNRGSDEALIYTACIVQMGGEPIKVERGDRKEVKVKSSSGQGWYTVVVEDGVGISCSCPGWSFRHHCKHLNKVNEK